MDSPTQRSPFAFFEPLIGLGALAYFLVYPRNTLSDFIVCSIFCLVLFFFGMKIGLETPKIKEVSKADRILALLSILLFITAWIYGFATGKLNFNTATTSILITSTYFYYAFIQNFLAQRYLALRMLSINQKRRLEKWSPELVSALMTGVIFGILHIPYPHLIIPATGIGTAFAYYYLTTGRLWAVVCAHALIASPSLFWYLDDNPFTELMDVVGL